MEHGLVQGSEGAVVRAQVHKGAAGEAHNTRDIVVSLYVTQGAVSEAHVAPGSVLARECATDG